MGILRAEGKIKSFRSVTRATTFSVFAFVSRSLNYFPTCIKDNEKLNKINISAMLQFYRSFNF